MPSKEGPGRWPPRRQHLLASGPDRVRGAFPARDTGVLLDITDDTTGQYSVARVEEDIGPINMLISNA
jgi:NAD(P)-dependent dehydrogenase (short-subunit alcohol dehydrogenase family)